MNIKNLIEKTEDNKLLNSIKENKGNYITVIVIILLVVMFFYSFTIGAPENRMVGTWVCENVVNGYPDGMVIKENGTAIFDGFDCEWYIENEKIFFEIQSIFLSDKEYNFKFKGSKLYLDGFAYTKTDSSHSFDLELSKGFKIKKEDEILQDILDNDYFFDEYGVVVDSYTITNRLTDKENDKDLISVSVVGLAEQITYYADYELTYVYSNNEWILDDYYCMDSYYEITETPDDKILQEYLNDGFAGECVINSCQKVEDGVYEYTFTQNDSESHKGFTVVCEGTINLNFTLEYENDLSSGKCGFWYITGGAREITDVKLNSDITGEWKYENGKEHFYLTVYKATENEVSYDFDLAFYETHVWGKEQHCELKTDETKEKAWVYEDCGEYMVLKTTGSIFNIEWCGGLSDKDYYLEYRSYNEYYNPDDMSSGFYVDDRPLTRAE